MTDCDHVYKKRKKFYFIQNNLIIDGKAYSQSYLVLPLYECKYCGHLLANKGLRPNLKEKASIKNYNANIDIINKLNKEVEHEEYQEPQRRLRAV